MGSRLVRPAKSLLKGYQRHLRSMARSTAGRAARGTGKENIEMVQVAEPRTGHV